MFARDCTGERCSLIQRSLAAALVSLGFAFAAALSHAADKVATDEPLNPDASAFFGKYRIPAHGELAYAIAGLGAPTGTDNLSFGKKWVDAFLAGKPLRQELLEVQWDADAIDCWLYEYPRTDAKKCASDLEVSWMLRKNQEILGRLRHLTKLAPENGALRLRAGGYLSAVKLALIDISLDARQLRTKEALDKWLHLHRFLTGMSSTGTSWVETAINLVNEGSSLSVLEGLLLRAKELTPDDERKIKSALGNVGLERFQIPNILLSEYALLMEMYASHPQKDRLLPNFMTNRQYCYSKNVLAYVGEANLSTRDKVHAQACPLDISAAKKNARYAESVELLGSSIDRVPTSLIDSMFDKSARISALLVQMRIKRQNIAELGIPKFLAGLKKTEPRLFPADTEVLWDAEKRLLVATHPRIRGAVEIRIWPSG